MLDVSVEVVDGTTVVDIGGRLDVNGAVSLERKLAQTPGRSPDVILDLGKVDFVSSAGIRVLTQLLKESVAHQGSVVLTGMKPAVRDILDMTGMLGLFAVVDSRDAAMLRLRSRRRSEHSRRLVKLDALEYDTTTDTEAECAIQLWMPEPSSQPGGETPLLRATLQELNLAFGLGGLGADAGDASKALGEFVCTRAFVAVVPAGSGGLVDCLIPREEATMEIFVARAVGFSGTARIRARLTGPANVTLRRLLADAFTLAEIPGQAPPDFIGLLIHTGQAVVSGGYYADDLAWRENRLSEAASDAPATLILAVVGRGQPGHAEDQCLRDLRRLVGDSVDSTHSLHAHAILLRGQARLGEGVTLEDQLAGVAGSGVPAGLLHVGLDTSFREADVRIFVPSRIEPGTLRRIRIEVADDEKWREEWDTLTRRIYSDSARVVLKPLTGGFTSRTYRAESYDREGRKQLPTVLKIGSVAVTEREVQAYRACVEKFILNNSTTIMGTERCGDWAGLRYNFLGVTGPDSRITWLENTYKTRPSGEFIGLLDRVFTDIFKPWYGQPRWEVICPFSDQDPRSLFESLLDVAQSELGISAEDESLPCPPLGVDLPNPFHFLKYGYAERRGREFRWYTGITHGDLNLKNILLDERENIYIIDFSESRQRNIVSDFARLEPIVKLEFTRLDGPDDLLELLRFEQGLACARRLDERPAWHYAGSDPMVEKAYETICRLRRYADQVTLFETNLIPYLVAVLEWTLPVVCYWSLPKVRKQMAAYSAALITRQILELESTE